ncbi:DUF535 family protein [Helicobacter cetorum]|uniref:Uncharacterized protein n=1 Tax=Helicobacter cetorum (strain ATCC BAA-540 / CCUG 52418 / MIT 99-5656) TaxID=1163745 RepID=I0ESS5_HELCM|nr:DUF535 family protein [Helicobacter cetorum]AFI05994.1 hypothetical protein HCD_04960 [Helicobacter cetorum MIT 99-5656]
MPYNNTSRFLIAQKYFCDSRLTIDERRDLILKNLLFLQNIFIKIDKQPKSLTSAREVCFFETKGNNDDVYRFYFQIAYNRTFTEGFIETTICHIKNEQRNIICRSSMCLFENHWLITSVQGNKHYAYEEHIKFLTKNCYMQPHFLLIELQKIFTRLFKCDKTLGILNEFQASNEQHRQENDTRYIKDYDAFFKECKAEYITIGKKTYFNLLHTHKDLNDYPSKKRSFYRKRFNLLEMIENSVKNIFVV